MENELLRVLSEIPWTTVAVGVLGGGVGGYAWQRFRGVAQFGQNEQGVYQDIRPSLSAEKTLNSIQGAVAGGFLAYGAELMYQGGWNEWMAFVVGVSLPYLIRAALDTDRLPAGMKRRK